MLSFSYSVFQEPRGVMRIFQLIFAICALSTTANFIVTLHYYNCATDEIIDPSPIVIKYPFRFEYKICAINASSYIKDSNKAIYYSVSGNLSSDAQFFVATGVLSLMYSLFIIAIYGFIDDLYKSKSELPLADFMVSTILAIFWLSGSAAWSNGTSTLKLVTDADILRVKCQCSSFSTSSFAKLNISLVRIYLQIY